MLTLPNAIVPVLHPFATLFRNPTWQPKSCWSARYWPRGQRTVAAALRVMGLSDDRNYARYHQVLNRAVWSPRQAARILLGLLIPNPPKGLALTSHCLNNTVTRRKWLPQIGCYRTERFT